MLSLSVIGTGVPDARLSAHCDVTNGGEAAASVSSAGVDTCVAMAPGFATAHSLVLSELPAVPQTVEGSSLSHVVHEHPSNTQETSLP